MPIFRKGETDPRQTQAQAMPPGPQMPQPVQTYGPNTYQRGGDYTLGHPGLPPKNYKAPKERR